MLIQNNASKWAPENARCKHHATALFSHIFFLLFERRFFKKILKWIRLFCPWRLARTLIFCMIAQPHDIARWADSEMLRVSSIWALFQILGMNNWKYHVLFGHGHSLARTLIFCIAALPHDRARLADSEMLRVSSIQALFQILGMKNWQYHVLFGHGHWQELWYFSLQHCHMIELDELIQKCWESAQFESCFKF